MLISPPDFFSTAYEFVMYFPSWKNSLRAATQIGSCVLYGGMSQPQGSQKCLFTKVNFWWKPEKFCWKGCHCSSGLHSDAGSESAESCKKTATRFSSLPFLILNMRDSAVQLSIDSLVRVEQILFVLMSLFCATSRPSASEFNLAFQV